MPFVSSSNSNFVDCQNPSADIRWKRSSGLRRILLAVAFLPGSCFAEMALNENLAFAQTNTPMGYRYLDSIPESELQGKYPVAYLDTDSKEQLNSPEPLTEAQLEGSAKSTAANSVEEADPRFDFSENDPASHSSKFSESLEKEEPKTLQERLDKLGLVYSNDDDPILQELWFLGRYHGQYHGSDGDMGGESDWENRRFRIGTQAKLFEKLTLHVQMISANDMDKFYNGFSELWVSWKFDDAFILSVGQQKHRFTHERNVSSRYINTLERSMLVNMFNSDYTPGITLSGAKNDWLYYTGFFSNATSSDMGDSFTNFDSGYSYLLSATKDLKDGLGFESAHWNFCLLHSDANENATNWNHFDQGLSTALIVTNDRRYMIAETLAGLSDEKGNAFGVNIQPGMFLTDKLQLTTRYQVAVSDDEQGLLPQRRYERPAGMESGDLYQAGYGGFNYFIAGHRIKAMSGVEYSNMNGDGLWTASVMFRTYWGPHSSGPFPMAQTL